MTDDPKAVEDRILAAAAAARRQSRIGSLSNIIAIGTGVGVAVIGVASLGEDGMFGIIAGMIVVFPMKWLAMTILGRPHGLGVAMRPDKLTGEVVVRMPRLGWPAISDDDVLSAGVNKAFGPSLVNAGPVSTSGSPTVAHGVLLSTWTGLVFLPDAESMRAHKTVEFMKGLTKMVADQVLEGSGELLGVALDRYETRPPTAIGRDGAFVAESLKVKAHFCLPWAEIVESAYDSGHGVCLFTRQGADGAKQVYAVFAPQPEVCREIFGDRLVYEVNRTLMERFIGPKRDELLPALREKFAGIYGDSVGEHEDEIEREALKQAVAWLDADVDSDPVLIEALRPTLEVCLEQTILPDSLSSLLASFALSQIEARQVKVPAGAARPA